MISVVIAAHNSEAYISSAIESILNQTYQAFELIVVDDSSTDNTWSIIQNYATKDSRLKAYQAKVKHGGLARNIGVSYCKYNYVALLDSDDIAFKDRLENQLSFMQDHHNIVVLGTFLHRITSEGILMDVIGHGPQTISDFHDLDRRIELIPIYGTTAMIRKDAFNKVGGFANQVEISQDAELWDRIAEYGECLLLPEVQVYYRQHEQSISVQNLSKKHKWDTYIKTRHVMRLKGKVLLIDEFLTQYNTMPMLEKFGILMRSRSVNCVRNARIHKAHNDYLAMFVSYAQAIAYHPVRFISRLFQ